MRSRASRGDFVEYAGLRRELSDRESSLSRRRKADRRRGAPSSRWRSSASETSSTYRRVDRQGIAVVVDPGLRSASEGPRPLVVTLERQARRLSLLDFPDAGRAGDPDEGGQDVQRPQPAAASRAGCSCCATAPVTCPAGRAIAGKGRGPADDDPEVRRVREAIRAHPCHACPDREDHARWAERYVKLERETATMRHRIEQRTNTIARQFDRVCEVLEELDYLEGESVTQAGAALSRIYSELDLVAAECLRQGIWADLEAPALAAVLSALVFESRNSDDVEPPRIPGGAVRDVLSRMVSIFGDLDALEREHRVSFLRDPDLGFAWAAYRWAGGATLEDVLDDVDLAPGDFVRWVKQVLDLVEQVGDAAGESPLRRTAREVVRSMRRGVVAFSSEIDS